MFKIFGCAIIALLCLSSCEKSSTVYLGKAKHYDDWFLCKYKTQWIVIDTLVFEFNKDARGYVKEDVEFEIVEHDVNGNPVSLRNVLRLKKNGRECDGNILRINTNDRDIELAIAFNDSAEERKYNIYFHPLNYREIMIDDAEFAGPIIEKEVVMNPLKKGVWIGFVSLVIFVLTWIFIAHLIVNPHVRFSKVMIDYGNGLPKNVRMGFAYQLLCTNKRVRIPWYKKFFVGDVKVEVNEFWDHPITIKSRRFSFKRLRLGGVTNHFFVNKAILERKKEFVVTNSQGKQAKIKTS